jgi:hypothetical protein
MTRSKLVTGLLVAAFALTLGSWSSIVVADRYQRSHQLTPATGVSGPVAPPNPRSSFERHPLGDESSEWEHFKHDWPRIPDLPGVTTLQYSGFWEMFYAADKNICGMTSYLIWGTPAVR